jgi:hypothetical protein
VVDREHVDAVFSHDVVDAEGKAPKSSTANAAFDLRCALGMLFNAIEAGFHRVEERVAEARQANFVPA